MIFYMLADQPHSEVTKIHGLETNLSSETLTASTLSPRVSFMNLQSFSSLAFFSSKSFFSSSVFSISKPSLVIHLSYLPSISFKDEVIYSSIASSKKITSKFFLRKRSKNGDSLRAAKLSPVI